MTSLSLDRYRLLGRTGPAGIAACVRRHEFWRELGLRRRAGPLAGLGSLTKC